MEREVRYCTTEDGVRIAYCVEGEGPPLVVTPYFLESFALHDVFPAFAEFMREVASGYTAIRYDARGTGLSQKSMVDFTIGAFAKDIQAVVDAAGLDTFSLVTFTAMSQAAAVYAHKYPERVKRLAIFGAYTGPKYIHSRDILNSLCSLARANWSMAVKTMAYLSTRDAHPATTSQQAEMMSRSVSGENWAAMFEATYEHDLLPVLSGIRAPTLVVHRLEDTACPFQMAQDVATAIPNARLVPVPGKANQPAGGDTRPILDAIRSFLDEDPETRALPTEPAVKRLDSAFHAILFTDLVGHTEMMSRLGDERGREVLREHERITREVLKAHGGTEVKTMGDGFMASFGSVTKAVECAVALQKAIDERNRGVGARRPFGQDEDARSDPSAKPGSDSAKVDASPLQASVEQISVRVGLNAGEPIEEDGDLFGATVILASRIAARAEGGEILVADTVRGLCSGKGFLFADRGEFVAKGFEEPVRVYEVSWRG